MLGRDNFLLAVKRILASRAGHRCSNPDCNAATSGPQLNPGKATNIGVAAHISAAAEGGARFDPSMTAVERAHIRNAIWLCQSCAKMIDDDPEYFSRKKLEEWKEQREATASSVLGKTFPPELPPTVQELRDVVLAGISGTAEQITRLHQEQVDLLWQIAGQIETLSRVSRPDFQGRRVSDLIADLEAVNPTPIVGPSRWFEMAASIASPPRLIIDTSELVDYAIAPYGAGMELEDLARTYMFSAPSRHAFVLLPTSASELFRYFAALPTKPLPRTHLTNLQDFPAYRVAPPYSQAMRIRRLLSSGKIADSRKIDLHFDIESIHRSEMFTKAHELLARSRRRQTLSDIVDSLNLAFIHAANSETPRSHLLVSSSRHLKWVSTELAEAFGGEPVVVDARLVAVLCHLDGLATEKYARSVDAAREAATLQKVIEQLLRVLRKADANQLVAAATRIRTLQRSLAIFGHALTEFSRSLDNVVREDWNAPLHERELDEKTAYTTTSEQVNASFDALLDWLRPLEEAMMPFIAAAHSEQQF